MGDNKKIFKNVIFLYFRMLFVITLTLLSIRFLYNTLGINGFGLFNLIISFVALFSFLNNAMRNTTQRFLNVAYADENKENIKNTFSIAFYIHCCISIILVIVAETIGLWLLNNVINIPASRYLEANIIYQLAIITTCFTILSVPYQAILIARQRMSLYAYISIFDAILKFISVCVLFLIENNRLVIYASGLLITSIVVLIIYICALKNSNEIQYFFRKNNKLRNDMIGFSSWNVLGQISTISANQGNMVILNVYFGIIINAGYAIAQQVNALLNNFVSTLQTAFNPQIVDSFAKKDFNRHGCLVLNASRYSLYLTLFLTFPFLFFSDYILQLWLGSEIPEFTILFTNIVLIVAFFESISGPFWMSAHARGNIKRYQIIISIIMLINIPMIFITIKLYNSIELAIITNVIVSFLCLVFRLLYFFKAIHVEKRNIIMFFKNLIIIGIIVIFSLYLQSIDYLKAYGIFDFIIKILSIYLGLLVILVVFCIPKSEVLMFLTKIMKFKSGEAK